MMSKVRELVKKLRRCAEAYKNPPYGREVEGTTELMEQAADTIEALSAKLAEANMEWSDRYYSGGWISVEDRLPEKDGFYLVTMDGEIAGEDKPFTGLTEFENGKWFDDEDDYQCVLAWQPLPEPYRPSDEQPEDSQDI